MIFETLSGLLPGVFYSQRLLGKSGYYLLPLRVLPPTDQLHVRDYEGASHLNVNFTIGLVGLGGYVSSIEDAVGFLFYSRLPVMNLSTAIISYSRAWQKSVDKIELQPGDTTLVLKTTHFYVYHTASIATMVTCPDLSDEITSFLTMI